MVASSPDTGNCTQGSEKTERQNLGLPKTISDYRGGTMDRTERTKNNKGKFRMGSYVGLQGAPPIKKNTAENLPNGPTARLTEHHW